MSALSEKLCRHLATNLASLLPKGTGFALFVFDFGKKGELHYISNGKRKDIVKALQEWIDKS